MNPEILTPFTAGLVALGGWGYVILAMNFGLLFSKKSYQDQEKRGDEWKTAYEGERDARLTLERELGGLKQSIETNNHLLQDLKTEARERRPQA